MKNQFIKYTTFIFSLLLITSCGEEYLEEVPVDFISPDNAYTSLDGFEAGLVALHHIARDEYSRRASSRTLVQIGQTDIYAVGEPGNINNYDFALLTSQGGFAGEPGDVWNWVYGDLLPAANTIISRAKTAEIDWTEEQKNRIMAEAQFFRAYGLFYVSAIFGDVPIVDQEIKEVKLNFTRDPVSSVLEFVINDLTFARQHLPEVQEVDGGISSSAVNHLLAEVYLTVGSYDEAIQAASAVINSGNYELMTERFGTIADQPGDVFYDLFYDGNQNRSSGNLESIWVQQHEFQVQGGGPFGNDLIRAFGPRYWALNDYDGNPGTVVVNDSIGRGVAWFAPTNYFKYDIWESDFDIDMRNSQYNIRRNWYFNNPDSPYFGERVDLSKYAPGQEPDSLIVLYPLVRKGDGINFSDNGRFWQDLARFRLAETYLLRAEAYLMKGELENAAADINVVRARANATPVEAADVDINYLLDERARELTLEENRMRTLNRFGLFVERVDLYNFRATGRIQLHRSLWPIPQDGIDSNSGAEFPQNDGY